MKQIIYKAGLLLCVLICLISIQLCVSAEESEALFEASPEQENTIVLPDSDDLAEGYINELFNSGAVSSAAPRLKTRRITQGSRLTGVNQTAYKLIRDAVTEIAAGRETSTELQLSRDALGVALKYYYASDLSVTDVIGPEGQPTAEAKAAMNQIIGFNIKTVMDALMADYPYEFYWFDKTKGYVHSSCSFGTSASGDFICFPKVYNLRMSVSPDYAYQGQRYLTDKEETGRASDAAKNAGSIIESNTELNDLEKLTAYKNKICELTSYDKTASSSGTYGDPWQMVYVFDNDPDTNVVCEGYSKAFQYLCDNSDFSDDSIECNSVTGIIKGVVSNGLHMWNLVSIAGETYHADITNSDTGTAGSRGQLFLAGTENADLSGYSFSNPKLSYTYDADTGSLFSDILLQIADHAYQASEIICSHVWDLENPELTEPSCEETGRKVYSCIYDDSHKKVVRIRMLGHKWDEGTVTTPAGCETEGVKTYTCINDSTHTYTEPVPAAGHQLTKTEAKAATCEEDGNTGHYICGVCGKLFKDEEGTEEISREETVVPATGHDWDQGIVTIEPTDRTPGVRSYTCKNDPAHIKTEEIRTAVYEQYLTDKTEADKVAEDLNQMIELLAEVLNLTSLSDAGDSAVSAVKNAYAAYNKLSAVQQSILKEESADLVIQLEAANAIIEELETKQKAEEEAKKQQEESAAKAAEQARQAALAKEAAAEEAAGFKSVAAAEAAILSMNNDEEPENTAYGPLSARVVKVRKKALKVQWKQVTGAAGYIVYANKCGKSNKYVKIEELAGGSAASYTLTKINGKALSKNTYYKILIAAYKNSSTGKRVITICKTIYAATSGGKNGNPAKLTLNKKKATVKVKKKLKLSAKQTGKSGMKLKKYRNISFESSNPKIATVTKKGVVKGVRKGKCYIYVYAQNGLSKRVKLTVK